MSTNVGALQGIQYNTLKVDTQKLIEQVREISVARRVFPIETRIKVHQKVANYWEMDEVSQSQYELDLVGLKQSQVASVERIKSVPLVQGSLYYDRHQKARIVDDIIKMDRRQQTVIRQNTEKEDIIALAGDTKNQVTSFDDVTNNTTAVTTHLNVTTFALFTATLAAIKDQLRTGLKSKLNPTTPLILVVSSDVYTLLESVFSTIDDTRSSLNYALNLAGISDVIWTNYLGSDTGAASRAAALIARSPEILSIWDSPMETIATLDGRVGIHWENDWRTRPVFYEPLGVLYDSAVVIA